MMNFLALIGWNPGTEQELFTTKELTDLFEITDIQSSGGAFNVDKLNWMNKQYLERLTVDEQFAYLKSALPETTSNQSQYSEERLLRLVPTVFERVHSQAEIRTAAEAGEYDWVFAAPAADLALVAWKKDTEQTAWVPRLQTVRALWENADFSSPETIKEAIWEYAETEGRGEVLWPTRVALTGLERSPDPFTSAYIIGREETLSRLQTICDKMGA